MNMILEPLRTNEAKSIKCKEKNAEKSQKLQQKTNAMNNFKENDSKNSQRAFCIDQTRFSTPFHQP